MNDSRSTAIDRYVRRTRNPAKQRYAAAYGAWLLGRGREPDWRDFAPLSLMGAQAVEMSLRGLS